jgi:hypothetical protein
LLLDHLADFRRSRENHSGQSPIMPAGMMGGALQQMTETSINGPSDRLGSGTPIRHWRS